MDFTQIPITLTMTVAQINVVLAGLGKLPHDDVNDMIVGIRRLALEQVQAREQAQAKPEEQKAAADSESTAG